MVPPPILLAQTLPLGPPHVWRLSGVSGFDRNMFVFSRLGRVFFSERRNGPFPTQAHVSEAAHGPAYDPQDAQEAQSTTCPPLFVFDVVALPDRTPLPRCLPWAGQAPFLAWRYSSRCLVGSVVSSPGFVVLRSWR